MIVLTSSLLSLIRLVYPASEAEAYQASDSRNDGLDDQQLDFLLLTSGCIRTDGLIEGCRINRPSRPRLRRR